MIKESDLEQLNARWDEVNVLYQRIEAWNKEYNPEYSSPFKDLSYKMQSGIRETRMSLILQMREKFVETYGRNLPIEKLPDFKKMMNEDVGEDGFDAYVMKNYFDTLDKSEATKMAYENLKELAGGLVPYFNKPDETLKGKTLSLRAHTWSSWRSGSGYISTSGWPEELAALSKLIDVEFNGADPLTISEGYTFAAHLVGPRNEEDFYGRQNVSHKQMSWYQFFKNGKLKIGFKDESTARRVAGLIGALEVKNRNNY